MNTSNASESNYTSVVNPRCVIPDDKTNHMLIIITEMSSGYCSTSSAVFSHDNTTIH